MKTKPDMPKGTLRPEKLKGEIEFCDVHFEYPSRPKEHVFKGLSFSIKPGTMTAFVGDSGAGKSTVSSLLMRA